VHARINVVTLPDRESVQLTVYNSADLTMVKETRGLTFSKGLNRLEFSWANTLIDPTSVEFRANGVEVLDVSFPPRVTNTLEWRIKSDVAGEVTCEIRYFTSGIYWAAMYQAQVDRNEQRMTLTGSIRVANNSGEDYDNAQVRVVVGEIHLVDKIAQLARAGRPTEQKWDEAEDWLSRPRWMRTPTTREMVTASIPSGGGPVVKREVVKESISEYFLYTVEGRDTIPTGWIKALPALQARDIPVTSYEKYERARFGQQVVRHYRFQNDVASHLGQEPLPNGEVYVYRQTGTADRQEFIKRVRVKYIPVGEWVELALGEDRDVLIRPTLMNWTRTNFRFNPQGDIAGYTTAETWEIQMHNCRDIPVVADIRRNFTGQWTLQTDAPHEKVDATKVKFVRPLQPREKQSFTYTLTTVQDTSAPPPVEETP
jgi:hypothetical protein